MPNKTPLTGDAPFVVTPEVATAGAITYWRLDGTVDLAKLRDAWVSENLHPDLLPLPPEFETCLHRAVNELAAKRCLVRPLARRGAWAVISEEVIKDGNEEHLKHNEECQVRYAAGAVVVTPSWSSHAPAILASFETYKQTLVSTDISLWLTKLAKQVSACGLRDTGGVYFVPRDQVEFWRAVARAIKVASDHKVFRIPALHNDEAVEAILDAVTQEATKAAEQIEADLQKSGDEALGARALRTRAAACAATLAKIASYEELLGVKAEAIKARIEDLRAGVAAAALTADEDEEQVA